MTDAAHILEEIRDELQRLRRLEESRAKVEDGTPLSRAEFCRVLGIDLKTTLEPLIKARRVKTVPWTRGEVRIPVGELHRFQRDGIPVVKQPKPLPKGGAANDGATGDIGDIDIT